MSTAFSNDGSDVIQRQAEAATTDVTKTESALIAEVYEMQRSVDWINQNKFTRVALQFPDELLRDAASVVSQLQAQTQAQLFILGDTSYGSCCVDEVSAEHNKSDAIIHYGRTCLSPTSRLPVLYVYGKQHVDVQDLCKKLQQMLSDHQQRGVVLYDVVYSHAADSIQSEISTVFPNFIVSQIEIQSSSSQEKTQEQSAQPTVQSESKDSDVTPKICDKCIRKFGRTFSLKADTNIEDYIMLYIGGEGLTLHNFMMTFNRCQFHTYNPKTAVCRQETLNVNKKLMKRYYMIEKAKDAQIVGILAGTLGVANYMDVIDRLKTMCKAAGKKTYTFVVGKLNVPKLANFAEVDVYVLVACPENSLVDSTEFYHPIVTPYEMEIACNQAREWTGEYVTDFRELLPGAASYVELEESADHTAHMDVSLVTGKVRRMGVEEAEETHTSSGALLRRDDALTVANTAGNFLSDRSWQGLEEKLGQTPVVKAVEGGSGIAMGYQHETEAS